MASPNCGTVRREEQIEATASKQGFWAKSLPVPSAQSPSAACVVGPRIPSPWALRLRFLRSCHRAMENRFLVITLQPIYRSKPRSPLYVARNIENECFSVLIVASQPARQCKARRNQDLFCFSARFFDKRPRANTKLTLDEHRGWRPRIEVFSRLRVRSAPGRRGRANRL